MFTSLTSQPRSSWTFFFLVSYIASSPLEAFAFHCIPAATGISFMLIIVRVGLGFSWAEPVGSQLGLAPMSIAARAQTEGGGTYPLTMIRLDVTRTVERETVTDFALPRGGQKGDGIGDGDSDSARDAADSV